MAVDLRRIVLAPKTDIVIGKWHNGKVPRAEFPMGKGPYRLGNSFQWCVIKFNVLGLECLVLVVLNLGKEKFEAVLGVTEGQLLRVLCSYEYHASEPGWHCHAACGNIQQLPVGYMRSPWMLRIPGAKAVHRRQDFKISDEISAQRAAFSYYRVGQRGPLI